MMAVLDVEGDLFLMPAWFDGPSSPLSSRFETEHASILSPLNDQPLMKRGRYHVLIGCDLRIRILPQKLTRRAVDAHQSPHVEFDDLPNAVDLNQYRRSVRCSVVPLAPGFVTRCDIKGDQGTLFIVSEMNDDATTIYEWRC